MTYQSIIDYLAHVEDTKGNNGDKGVRNCVCVCLHVVAVVTGIYYYYYYYAGKLYVTNLRMVWVSEVHSGINLCELRDLGRCPAASIPLSSSHRLSYHHFSQHQASVLRKSIYMYVTCHAVIKRCIIYMYLSEKPRIASFSPDRS